MPVIKSTWLQTVTAAGGTFTLNNNIPHENYLFTTTGAVTLVGSVVITAGASVPSQLGETYKGTWDPSAGAFDLNGNTLTIGGAGVFETIPQFLAEEMFEFTIEYDGSAYNVFIKSNATDTTIDTASIEDSAVTLAKIQNVAANSILVRNAGTSGVLTEVALADTQILIGDGTGFTAAVLSGDATMTNAGVISLAANVVGLTELYDITEGTVLIGTATSPVELDIGNTNAGLMIGNGTTATIAILSGDVTMTNAGVVTIANDAVTTAKIINDAVTGAKIADDTIGLNNLDANVLYSVDTSDAATGANTTKTTLATVTINANDLHDTNTGIRLTISGSTGATANAKTMDIDIVDAGGTTNLMTNSVTGSPNNLPFRYEGTLLRTGPSSWEYGGIIHFNGTAPQVVTNVTGTLGGGDTWAANNIVINFAGTNGVAAANDITCRTFITELLL